jgi:hypothetical protein
MDTAISLCGVTKRYGALTAVANPDIMLLDEPTRAL